MLGGYSHTVLHDFSFPHWQNIFAKLPSGLHSLYYMGLVFTMHSKVCVRVLLCLSSCEGTFSLSDKILSLVSQRRIIKWRTVSSDIVDVYRKPLYIVELKTKGERIWRLYIGEVCNFYIYMCTDRSGCIIGSLSFPCSVSLWQKSVTITLHSFVTDYKLHSPT